MCAIIIFVWVVSFVIFWWVVIRDDGFTVGDLTHIPFTLLLAPLGLIMLLGTTKTVQRWAKKELIKPFAPKKGNSK